MEFKMKSFDKKYCEQVQNGLTFEKIENIWKNFREAGNSIEGKIIKMVRYLFIERTSRK